MRKMFQKDKFIFISFLLSAVLTVIIYLNTFDRLNDFLNNVKSKYDIFYHTEQKVLVVNIDEESDRFLGEKFPYSLYSYEKVFENLIKNKAKNIIVTGDNNLKLYEKISKGYPQLNFFMGVEKKPFNDIIDFDNTFYPSNMTDDHRKVVIEFNGEESIQKKVSDHLRGEKELFFNKKYDSNNFSTVVEIRYPFNIRKLFEVVNFSKLYFDEYKLDLSDYLVIIAPAYKYSKMQIVKNNILGEKIPISYLMAIKIVSLKDNKTLKNLSDYYNYTLSFILIFLTFWIVRNFNPLQSIIYFFLVIFFIIFTELVIYYFGYVNPSIYPILISLLYFFIWIPIIALKEYQKKFEIEAKIKNEREVSSLKNNFISLVSHDLKTPVAKIFTMLEIIRKDNVENKLNNQLDVIYESTYELNKSISSVLEISKLNKDKFRLNSSVRDINLIINEVVDDLSINANRKKISINRNLGTLFPVKVDISLFKKIVSNLVENAIKYGNIGGKIIVSTYDDLKWIYLDILDNGPGIPEDEQNHIFKKFYRIKNNSYHSEKGTGLGLYLVKYFVELHKGKILVKNNIDGNGVCFTIKIPNKC